MDDLDDLFEAEAERQRAQAEREEADPRYRASLEAKRAADHAKGVRLGWWDEDGEPLQPPADEDEDEEEDEQ